MNVQIWSRAKMVAESSAINQNTIIISITEVDSPLALIDEKNPFIKGVLRLEFDDEVQGENIITDAQAAQVVEFINNRTCDNLIVHCFAGISRSAGMAAAISKAIDGDDMWVFKNGCYVPNMCVYRKVLNAFMCPIDEKETAEKWNTNISAWRKLNEFED